MEVHGEYEFDSFVRKKDGWPGREEVVVANPEDNHLHSTHLPSVSFVSRDCGRLESALASNLRRPIVVSTNGGGPEQPLLPFYRWSLEYLNGTTEVR